MAKDNKEEDKNNGKVKRKEYEKALHKLQVELCHLQACKSGPKPSLIPQRPEVARSIT